MRSQPKRWVIPLLLFLCFAGVYCAVSADRLARPSPNNHFVHQALAWLDGRLDVGTVPPGHNDWACFDVVARAACPNDRSAFVTEGDPRYRWYVSFPPVPAVVLLPIVAVFGPGTWDALFWALFAGLGPVLLFLVLRFLRETGRTDRAPRDDLLLTAIFGLGSVYFFVAVQGTVWFAAQLVAVALSCLYLLFSFSARKPIAAGLALGLAFMARPSTLFLASFFVLEALRESRSRALLRLLAFGSPLAVAVLLMGWYNWARFDDPLEFGHRFLQVRWRARIETWGLFSYHYLGRNLAVFLASVPWLLETPPYVRINGHGLALWFTTPNLFWTLWPLRSIPTIRALWFAVVPTALCTLLYQNTGWLQFGYRFSLDYLPLLFVLLALSGRRFGPWFLVFAVWSIAVNSFGAVTFGRFPEFYYIDLTQGVLFQPD